LKVETNMRLQNFSFGDPQFGSKLKSKIFIISCSETDKFLALALVTDVVERKRGLFSDLLQSSGLARITRSPGARLTCRDNQHLLQSGRLAGDTQDLLQSSKLVGIHKISCSDNQDLWQSS
jgi:hypothetical protein